MKFVLNSLTFHNCPVGDREKATFTKGERHWLLKRIHSKAGVGEAAILQTCNRLEFYAHAKNNFDVTDFLSKLIAEVRADAIASWNKYKREITGVDVINHLFEVAAGLDSQMPGENQILSQVKAAYRESTEHRTSKFVFHRLFHTAFRVGKTVRTKTNINCGAVSISLAAVELAKKKMSLSSSTACVTGAGGNAELVCKHLLEAGVDKLIIANRSREKAQKLSKRLSAGEVIGLKALQGALAEIDLLISSTAAAEPIVTYRQVSNVLADRKNPLLLIDIAVPRDIEAKAGDFDCVSLFNIDDLNEQISQNKEERSLEVPKARQIIADFTDDFLQWYRTLEIVPVITCLTQKASRLAQSQAKRYGKEFSPEDSDKLKNFAESLVKKMLHGPISFLKESGDEELSAEQLRAVDLINKMFFSEDECD